MRKIQVLPNPWAAIDAEARPCGAVPMDPVEHSPGAVKYVGAKLVATEIAKGEWRRVGKYVETITEPRYLRTWKFSASPVELPAPKGAPTGYYRDRLMALELIPADRESAAACRIKWREPADVIAESKSARRREFDAQHGAGAFDALQCPEQPKVSSGAE